jgi:signal transduction histidine kinase
VLNHVPHDLRVHADARLLTRVFQNLIANAIAHTPHGDVVLGAQASTGGRIELWVSDNGAGISQERIAHVFEKYETDRHGEHGAGLGLAIVKTFVEAHEGTVEVESTPGDGSTFRIMLPNAMAE